VSAAWLNTCKFLRSLNLVLPVSSQCITP